MHIWREGMDPRVEVSGAYWERNMLALLMARYLNKYSPIQESDIKDSTEKVNSGWYYDTENNWDGFKRVLSLDNGQFCFHIPDSFDVGDLPQIENNWDGHTTEEKWLKVEEICNVPDKRTINQWCHKYQIEVISLPHELFVLGPNIKDELYFTLEEFRDQVLLKSKIIMRPGVALEGVNQICLGAKIK